MTMGTGQKEKKESLRSVSDESEVLARLRIETNQSGQLISVQLILLLVSCEARMRERKQRRNEARWENEGERIQTKKFGKVRSERKGQLAHDIILTAKTEK
jgi:hypothetical protein